MHKQITANLYLSFIIKTVLKLQDSEELIA